MEKKGSAMTYPQHVIEARKVLCASCTMLASKWFRPEMWEDDDPQEVKDQTAKVFKWSQVCVEKVLGIKLSSASKLAVRKQDTFIRNFAASIFKCKDPLLMTQKSILLLEVANCTQCNVVAMTRDNREWNWLYGSTRKLLDTFLYPSFPDLEEEGMLLYSQMAGM